MRTYLVVIDDTPEAEIALRFAARRAAKTGGAVEILALMPKPDFLAWGGVQATMEDEARERAEELVERATGTLLAEAGAVGVTHRPSIKVKLGDPIAAIREAIAENDQIGALVLSAASSGSPGPLVSHFAGVEAGSMTCPIMIIPGSLSQDDLDRMS
jgi:nucleotide-binding universal stress UspA family protein